MRCFAYRFSAVFFTTAFPRLLKTRPDPLFLPFNAKYLHRYSAVIPLRLYCSCGERHWRRNIVSLRIAVIIDRLIWRIKKNSVP